MIIKRWKVGSLSMGIILVAFGILLLVSLIVKINFINIIYALSPIVLICLGAEILLHLFVKKDGDEVKIKYDFLSIIFISVILIISTGLYVLTGIAGFFETKEDMFTAFGIRTETVCKEYEKEFDDADKMEIFGDFYNMNLKVLSTDSYKIKIGYSVKINASDKDYAGAIADKIVKFDTENKKVRMISNYEPAYYDSKIDYPVMTCIIYLPKDKILDLSQCNCGYNITVDNAINSENVIRQQ